MKTLNFMLAALMFLFTVSAVSAQIGGSDGDWDNVKSLDVGQRVIIKTKNNLYAKGLLNKVTDDSIVVLDKKNKAQTFSRNDVGQIHTARKSKILGVVGGIVGGVGGAVVTTAILVSVGGGGSETADYFATGGIIAATAGGAVLGNRIGNRYRKSRLVYQFR
ncbi:MAG: hypothetical protein H7Z37_12085 [Pyrinomonadaceae bacterium]|nr:hypothetical protein [Pyrinomonadaceae bacterium]